MYKETDYGIRTKKIYIQISLSRNLLIHQTRLREAPKGWSRFIWLPRTKYFPNCPKDQRRMVALWREQNGLFQYTMAEGTHLEQEELSSL